VRRNTTHQVSTNLYKTCMAVLLHSILEHGHFMNTDISHGSVATSLGCSGLFNDDVIANLLLSL